MNKKMLKVLQYYRAEYSVRGHPSKNVLRGHQA